MLAHCVHLSVVLGCWNPKEDLVGFVGDKKKELVLLRVMPFSILVLGVACFS